MAGILSGCNSLFFQMKCDIYYATEDQDKYGKVNKKWTFDLSQDCSFYTLGDKSNDDNFTFDDQKFYKMETMLYGRSKKDIRVDSSGLYHPLSHILIANIRGNTCNTDTFFFETNGDYVGKPTIFEIKMVQPYIGPFSTVEYYKVHLERSDTQELNELAQC
jgi:hypothetical protein